MAAHRGALVTVGTFQSAGNLSPDARDLRHGGVVAPFLEVANRVTSVAVVTHGRRLAHMRFEPEESPYPFVAMVPQDVTEKLLAEAAAA